MRTSTTLSKSSNAPASLNSRPWARKTNEERSARSSLKYSGPKTAVADKQIIAWDMEGMSHEGDDKPQSAIVFGCSARPNSPLVGKRLRCLDMLEYILEVGAENPNAIHVGYAFRYDANMLLRAFSDAQLEKLYKNNAAYFKGGWYIRYIPGKIFQVSKRGPTWTKKNRRDQRCVTIYDFSAFFQQPFVKAAEGILGRDINPAQKAIVEEGKKARGKQTWDQLDDIVKYWSAEIVLMRDVFAKFRDVMCEAGFPLKHWYGPGALAEFVNTHYKIRPHLRGVQQHHEGTLPLGVHEAAKRAAAGGHIENYQIGRFVNAGSVDINSSYPYALTMVPSFAENQGRWVHRISPDISSGVEHRFGFYRIRYKASDAWALETRPMPLFWRDSRGLITFPAHAHGWYATPEAVLVANDPDAECLESWEWESKEEIFPWEFLHDMYEERQRLGKKNPLSLPFKLGPNSLYGKYAQTVGWNEEKKESPKNHALPIAAWVTSFARAQLWRAIQTIPIQNVIALSTDSVHFVGDQIPAVPISGEMGDWSYEKYDELLYAQSGMYHYSQNGEWTGVRSRGIYRSEFPVELVAEHMKQLKAGETWPPINLATRRLVLMGAARASKEFRKNWCTWQEVSRQISISDTGKRIHVPAACGTCSRGIGPWDEPHYLSIHSRSDGDELSHPRRLPWEEAHPAEVEEIRQQLLIEKDLV